MMHDFVLLLTQGMYSECIAGWSLSDFMGFYLKLILTYVMYVHLCFLKYVFVHLATYQIKFYFLEGTFHFIQS